MTTNDAELEKCPKCGSRNWEVLNLDVQEEGTYQAREEGDLRCKGCGETWHYIGRDWS